MVARSRGEEGSPPRDTIVALSTAPGRGAIAVVRLSGPGAEAVLRRVFRPREAARGTPDWRPALGRFVGPDGMPFDEGMATFMCAPRSYTGEDMAELHCHGGPAVVRDLLMAARDAGARPAAPGEFTRRAFLEGKIDLIQVEAVADLVAAETGRAARAALAQLDGRLSAALEEIWETLVEVGAHLEAAIDFPEEFAPGAGPEAIGGPMDGAALDARLAGAEKSLRALEASYRAGRALREGARVAILGRPNAGKSTLLNRLLGTDRAIMSPTPGTTRDTVEEVCDIGGIPVRLVDTAGLREAGDPIEMEGAERSRRAAVGADLCLFVIDAAAGPAEAAWARGERERTEAPALLVANKMDLPGGRQPEEADGFTETINISALTGLGLDVLHQTIARALAGEAGEAGSGGQHLLTRERHRDLVVRCREGVARTRGKIADEGAAELAAAHLSEAQTALSALLGRDYGEALLDRIFETFCIGK